MINSILDKILSKSKASKIIIGVRKYNDSDSLYVGYIVNYTDTLILLQHITKFGVEDGLMVEKIDNIESFEMDDDYIKSYQFLFENVNKIEKQAIKNIKLSGDDNWQYDLLKALYEEGELITVELNNDDLVTHGYIIDFDETFLQFKPIDKLGNEEGINIYKLADISSLSVGSLEGRKRQVFVDWKAKKFE